MSAAVFHRRMRTLSLTFTVLTGSVALFTLLLWLRPIPLPIVSFHRLMLMHPFTAGVFICAAMAMCCSWFGASARYPLCRFLGAFIFVAGAARIISNFTANWPQPDLALINGFGSVLFSQRMGLFTAADLCLLGPALFLSCSNRPAFVNMANRLAAAVLLASLFFMIGYCYHVPEFLNMLHYLPMSFYSALCAALIAVAILLRHPEAAFMKTFTSPFVGGMLARKLLPVIVMLPFALGLLRLYFSSQISFSVDLGVALIITIIIGVLCALTWLLAFTLNQSDQARTTAETGMRHFNLQLEQKVTERTQLLSESEAQLRETLEMLSEGAQFIDRNWRYTYVNEAAAKQGRRARTDLTGRTITSCFPGIEKTPLFAAMQSVMEHRTSARFENEFEYPDGSTAFFELSI